MGKAYVKSYCMGLVSIVLLSGTAGNALYAKSSVASGGDADVEVDAPVTDTAAPSLPVEDAPPLTPSDRVLDAAEINTIQEMSASLPLRPFGERMNETIPDLMTPDRVAQWLQYVEYRAQLERADRETELIEAASLPFAGFFSEDRAEALSDLYRSAAGFVKVDAASSEMTIVFEIPAVGLLVEDGVSIQDAGVGPALARLTAPVSKATWTPTIVKDMAGGVRFFQWELSFDGVLIPACTMEVMLRLDTTFGAPYIQYVRIVRPQILTMKLPGRVVEKEPNPVDLEKDCLIEAVNGDAIDPNAVVSDIRIGREELACGETSCVQIRRYSLALTPFDNKTDSAFGAVECKAASQDGRVIESVYQPALNYSSYPYAYIGVPYNSSNPPDFSDGSPGYSTRLCHLRYFETVGASGGSCNPATHIGWTNSSGMVTTASDSTQICVIPDARANSSANNYPSTERFRNCPAGTLYSTCTGAETQDATLPYEPPLDACTPWWSGDQWDRRNASIYYHLNWMHDAVDDYLTSMQCRVGGVAKYIDYQSGDNWGGQAAVDFCALIIGYWGPVYNPIWSSPIAVYHEYAHLLDLNVKSSGSGWLTGSAVNRGAEQCRAPLEPYDMLWDLRQAEGTARGANGIYTGFETTWQYEMNLSRYPNDVSWGQMGGNYHYLAWTVGWPNATRAMFKNTGLRYAFSDVCTGGIYLSGQAVKNTRTYVTSAGTDNTADCACYRAANPCGCGTLPSQISERENATKALCLSGPNYLHYEVDRTFNARTMETGDTWTDDATNLYYSGQHLGRPSSIHPEGSSLYYYDAPDRTGTNLATTSLPNGTWDYDNFTFFAGYGQQYYLRAYSRSGRDLQMQLVDSSGAVVAYNDDCGQGVVDPCITYTAYDANSHYVRIWDDVGGNGEYYLRFRQVNDDHNDYEPEGTPLALGQNAYMNGYLHANDVDYFRVFVPNNNVYSTASLPISMCSATGVQLRATLYSAARDGSGRFRNSASLATFSGAATCPTYVSYTYTPGGGNLTQGWYFIKVEAYTAGQTSNYRLKAGATPTEGMSNINYTIPASTYWDIMYNSSSANRIFRAAGYLQHSSDMDSYLLDLSGMDGRLVSVDVYGLDLGAAGARLDPTIILYSGTSSSSDNGYYDPGSGTFWHMAFDENGGLNDSVDPTDGNAHLTFRVVRGGSFIINVIPGAGSTPGFPYQVFIDVKSNDTADPALPAWN